MTDIHPFPIRDEVCSMDLSLVDYKQCACQQYVGHTQYLDYDVWKDNAPWMDVALIVNAMILIYVLFQIWYFPHMRAHPSMLVASLCFFESANGL